MWLGLGLEIENELVGRRLMGRCSIYTNPVNYDMDKKIFFIYRVIHWG